MVYLILIYLFLKFIGSCAQLMKVYSSYMLFILAAEVLLASSTSATVSIVFYPFFMKAWEEEIAIIMWGCVILEASFRCFKRKIVVGLFTCCTTCIVTIPICCMFTRRTSYVRVNRFEYGCSCSDYLHFTHLHQLHDNIEQVSVQ